MANSFQKPTASKITFSETQSIKIEFAATRNMVLNEDSILLGINLKANGFRPLILIYADHRFAGGDVEHGSGAQEESLFRRTNLCNGLIQTDFYPIRTEECVLVQNVTVFRATEKENYEVLNNTTTLDYVACPGIQNPKLDEDGNFSQDDEQKLRVKIRCIFQAAQRYGHNALVLGPLGCGAWRCPPKHVARIFKEEIDKYDGAFILVVFACLEVKESDYIVVNRGRPSNFVEFSRVFNVDSD
jgi:uncharacterized protein (TIGR02452 family)